MKSFRKLVIAAFILFSMTLFSGCDVYTYGTSAVPHTYENPVWAPPYYSGIRYYYLPDIETYYDLSNHDFIYLHEGQWIFSPEFPSAVYGHFDLNNCFTIALDVNVYQPWMHHHYYVSHYPRYYYTDYYDHNNIPYVRGFNENTKSAMYWTEKEREKARPWDNKELKAPRNFVYTKQDKKQQTNWSKTDNVRSFSDMSEKNQNPQKGKEQVGVNRTPQYNNVNNQTTKDNEYRQSVPNKQSRDNNAPLNNNSSDNHSNNAKREMHSTNYYGRTIGRPVKVEKQMKKANDDSRKKEDNKRY